MVQETDQRVADRAQLEGEEIPPSGEIRDFRSVPGVQSARYVLLPQDKASWVPAWQLNVDRSGVEYGIPTRLPRGQLDHYRAKRRPDGGRRFTLTQPENVLAEPKFECFIGDCRKRVRERSLLVGHVEKIHSQEAQAYKPLLDTLRQAIVDDNPKLAALIGDLAKTPDQPIEAVRAAGAEDSPWGEFACGIDDCPWEPKANARNPRLAQTRHYADIHGR